MHSNEIVEVKKKELANIERQLDNCRTSVLTDGWQTRAYSRKSRKWDLLAEEKRKLRDEIETLEHEQHQQNAIDSIYCIPCGAIDTLQCECE